MGIEAVEGVAETLPYGDSRFDFALMVTTICFLDDVGAAFREAYRVVKPGGALIVGFIDRENPLGRAYEGRKEQNVFYRDASFYSSSEVVAALERAGFRDLTWVQTLIGDPATFWPRLPPRSGLPTRALTAERYRQTSDRLYEAVRGRSVARKVDGNRLAPSRAGWHGWERKFGWTVHRPGRSTMDGGGFPWPRPKPRPAPTSTRSAMCPRGPQTAARSA